MRRIGVPRRTTLFGEARGPFRGFGQAPAARSFVDDALAKGRSIGIVDRFGDERLGHCDRIRRGRKQIVDNALGRIIELIGGADFVNKPDTQCLGRR